jgi:hypothetical protein
MHGPQKILSFQSIAKPLSSRLTMDTELRISSCYDPSINQSYSFQDISEALVRAEFLMAPPIYLTSADSEHEHLKPQNGFFHLSAGHYIVWGEKQKPSRDLTPLKLPVLEEPAILERPKLQLLDNEYDIVRQYLVKHAEIAQYLTSKTFPGRLLGADLREQRKTFKKLVSELTFFVIPVSHSVVQSARITISGIIDSFILKKAQREF